MEKSTEKFGPQSNQLNSASIFKANSVLLMLSVPFFWKKKRPLISWAVEIIYNTTVDRTSATKISNLKNKEIITGE